MDFYFVEHSHAVAVISCKSYLTSVDTEYITTTKPYVKQVWLFAECCPKGREVKLREDARGAGYKHLFYLYPWDGKVGVAPDRKEWLAFLKALNSLRKTRKGAGK